MADILVIHDVDLPWQESEERKFFRASAKTARCKGCFGCWLKRPGECVMHDGCEQIGTSIAKSRQVWIFSRILYGGFGVEVKRVLDRSIPQVLPFFSRRYGRMHHVPRYENQPEFHIVFHHAEDATEKEKKLAEKCARAMAINFNASSWSIHFVNSVPTGEDVREE